MDLLSALKNVRLSSKKRKLSPLSTVWGEALDPKHVLEEYPRPQMQRSHYINLNGYWNYAITSSRCKPELFDGTILVPFSPESPLSGVNRQLKPKETLIYERSLPLDAPPSNHERCILHFGAIDQYARILVNGEQVISHIGGYLPFSADITSYLRTGENLLTVYVEDHSDTSYHSTGKQKLKRGGMFYTAQSGIWQTVWMETVPSVYIQELITTPHYEKETVHVSVRLSQPLNAGVHENQVFCQVFDADGEIVSRGICTNHSDSLCEYSCYCDVNHMQSWSPDHPYLYKLRVFAGADEVTGYFAMRTFTTEPDADGHPRFCLNHRPLFLNGILDQGYWPDGLYTAPSDEALIFDIQTMKRLGFNMLRKHVKIESARWYYHCDRLGMIVWQDMVNGGSYKAPVMTWLPTVLPSVKSHLTDRLYPLLGRRNVHGREEFILECRNTVRALRSFPCISTWVIFNEGWGQFESRLLTKLFRELDPDRLIDSASGWYDRGYGDFSSAHVYFMKLSFTPSDRASVISEYGGYSCPVKEHTASSSVYGYKMFRDTDSFREAFLRLREDELKPLIKEGLSGAVYTQVSDIEDELNGLLTYDRKICKL